MATTVKDPVCDMKVNEETASAKSIYKGRTFYFCSTFCKQMFDREPEKYVQALEDRKQE
ncbi:MAG: YHS domain-containing protein [Chloroflexi bacterium]|nr:YHS domain-containing protein [Chloroflexota bacterium]